MRIIPDIEQNNRLLIMGDNLKVMEKLKDEGYTEKFNMIYFDGPFNSGLLFTRPNSLGFETVNPWQEWKTMREYLHLEFYLENYRQRIKLARDLLHEQGMFVLQTNQITGHYIKVVLDEIFGRENFLSEVIWKHSPVPWTLPERGPFGYQHETLFFYKKSNKFFSKNDPVCASVWDDLGGYEQIETKLPPFPSQKPERLIDRIIEFTTEEGDLVGDFYCGSGTFPLVAEKKKRRWIACDNTFFAIDTTVQRLKKLGVEVQLHSCVEDFDRQRLSGGEYTKTTDIPVSMHELSGLEKETNRPVIVNAREIHPNVDLANKNKKYTFNYLFPSISENGFDESQLIKVPRPVPVWEAGKIRLIVPDPERWVFYHLVHVQRNEYGMIKIQQGDVRPFLFDQQTLRKRTEEILSKIDGNWVSGTDVRTDYVCVTDVFGYQYHVPVS